MKKCLLLIPIITTFLLFGCKKNEQRSYEHWSHLINEKYFELNQLLQSVPCTNINDFEIIKIGSYFSSSYYLVHPNVKEKFEITLNELEELTQKLNEAASREGILNSSPPIKIPPLNKACIEGKPKLIYAKDLSIEEINAELPSRYEQIQSFYNDVPCTKPNDWSSHFLRVGCCHEGIAIHKTIRSEEMYDLVQIYNQLMERKLYLENTNCGLNNTCKTFAKPVICLDGKPFVELTQ